MEDFPGFFPVSGSSDSTGTQSQGGRNNSEVLETSNILSPEAIHIQSSLKSKRKCFKKDLSTQLGNIWLIISVICYLYDCSLLLLSLRTLTEFTILNHLFLRKHLDSTKILFLIISLGMFGAFLHVSRALPKPESDGFVYGHHIIQIIGQKQLSNKYWLLGLDIALFYTQILRYSVTFSTKRDYKTAEATAIDQEYDGSQGRTICARIDLLNSLRPHWRTVHELHTVEEEERREQTQDIGDTSRLTPGHLDPNYGSFSSSFL